MTEEKNPPKTKSGDFSLPWKAQKTKARFPHSHRPGYGCYTFSESNPRKELPPPPSRLFPRLILRLEKTAIVEYREVRPYFYGDFYPLLPYSLREETWTAWQWDRPERKDGLVVVLRRPRSPFMVMTLGLRHLNPKAVYEVEVRTAFDRAPVKEMSGDDLAHLEVQLADAPSSILIFYRRR